MSDLGPRQKTVSGRKPRDLLTPLLKHLKGESDERPSSEEVAEQVADFFPTGASCPIARMRRGKRVPIPPEWRGKVPQNINQRQSKHPRKLRRNRWSSARKSYPVNKSERPTIQERKAPTE